MDDSIGILATGIGATGVIDAWAIARRRWFGIALPDYGLVGRWFAHLARGRFRHDRIAASPSVRGERALGWIAHYLVGIGFAAVLVLVFGTQWLAAPTLLPALVVGIASVAAPFLVMQPGMGAGLAARRTPRPNAARVQSLVTHGVFGLGLFLAGNVASLLRIG